MTGDEKKIVHFPKAEVDPEERACRLKVEVERLASLPVTEWLFYIESDGVAEKHNVSRNVMKKMIEATVKDCEKKARANKAEDRQRPGGTRLPSRPRHSHIFARAENDHYVDHCGARGGCSQWSRLACRARGYSIRHAAGDASCVLPRMLVTFRSEATSSTVCNGGSLACSTSLSTGATF
jgi:hypothetical protein